MEDAVSPNSRNSWRYEDPAPGISLQDVEPISVRAEALIVRSSSALLQSNFVQIVGAATILSGIDYHHTNFLAALQRLPQANSSKHFPPVRHEAIAWINRVGQLYYFCKSKLVDEHLAEIDIPTIESVLPFRNKHSAHRSIDAPRTEDTPHLQFTQALTFSELGGQLWTPRPGKGEASPEHPFSATHYLAFQLQLPDGEYRNLAVEREHRNVMLEGYAVLESLLSSATSDV